LPFGGKLLSSQDSLLSFFGELVEIRHMHGRRAPRALDTGGRGRDGFAVTAGFPFGRSVDGQTPRLYN
jgi:hypothetical protein